MSARLGKRLKQAREIKGYTQEAMADLLGISKSGWNKMERGETQTPTQWEQIAQILDIPREEMRDMVFEEPASSAAPLLALDGADAADAGPRAARALRAPAQRTSDRRKDGLVPILGRALAGDPGKIVMLTEAVEWVEPPQSIAGVPGAYILYVHGTSMIPRYYPGERVHVHPHKPVAAGNFCVVQIGEDPALPEEGYIKQFLSEDTEQLRLKQLNPEGEIDFPMGRVIAIHRIVGSDNL